MRAFDVEFNYTEPLNSINFYNMFKDYQFHEVFKSGS